MKTFRIYELSQVQNHNPRYPKDKPTWVCVAHIKSNNKTQALRDYAYWQKNDPFEKYARLYRIASVLKRKALHWHEKQKS